MLEITSNHRGFSLIELLITVALIAFIAMIALPMTAAWIDGPDVTRSATQFQQALAKAKNIAIREGATLEADEHAAAVCAATTDNVVTITVKKRKGVVGDDPATRTVPDCDTDDDNEVFSAALPGSVTVKLNAADFSCACFAANGAVFNSAGTVCSSCSSQAVISANPFIISKGGESEEIALY